MKCRLIILLASIGAVLSATEEFFIEDFFIETPEGPQLLNGFTVFDQFFSYNGQFNGIKMHAAASFIGQHSKIPFGQLFTDMKFDDYILIQILHALYSKDTNSAFCLGELATFVYETEPNRGNDWIRENIEFPSEKSFQVVESLVTLDNKGIMNIPLPILKGILLIVDMSAALEGAVQGKNIEVIKWILEQDIHFDNWDKLLTSAFSNNRIDIVKVLIGKGALDNVSQQRKLAHLKSPKDENLLHLAAQSHRPAAVQSLLEAGLEPNAVDSDGYAALHRAVEAGDEEAIGLLVRGGAEVNQPTALGDLPIHIAVSKANLRVTKLLIKLGSSLDSKNDLGFTPLYAAENTVVAAILRYIEDTRWQRRMKKSKNCREYNRYQNNECDNGHSSSALDSIFGEEINNFFTNLNMREIFCHDNDIPFVISLSEIVNLFLRKGELSRMSSQLQFLLSLKASKTGNEELSEILINLGYDTPDTNIKPILDSIEGLNAAFMSFDENVKFKNETGHTKLHESASKGDFKSVEALVLNGADIEALTNDSWTPLHFAASQGHEGIVEFLVQKNASINAKTYNQETPLHLASANDHAGVVKILAENDADLNAEMNPDCATSLYIASRAGHLEVVEALVDADALRDPRDCGKYNLTPLQIAALNRRASIVQYLALHGADVNVRDNEGNTALYTAAWNGENEMVKTLIELGANVKLRVGKARVTALHVAAWRGHANIVQLLLQGGADPNGKDLSHATPLHWATTLDVTKLLLKNGSSVNIRTINRETPLHRASSLGHADIVRELLQSSADIDARTIDGKTPAYEAISHGQYSTLKILIESGADLYAIGPNNQTVLNFGISKGMLKLNSS